VRPILKRLIVWLLETLCQILLLSLLFFLLVPLRQFSRMESVGFALFAVAAVFMWASGYILTTGIVGVFLRSRKLWLYPTVVVGLFLAHVYLRFIAWHENPDEFLFQFQAWGAPIVFGCTVAGNWLLQKWTVPMVPGGPRRVAEA
jgi:hypothetical protein